MNKKKIIEIKADKKMKIDIRIAEEDKHGFFKIQEERIVLLSNGQSFIGIVEGEGIIIDVEDEKE